MDKKQYGKFYTKNAEYIIRDLVNIIPKDAVVIDPFCGEGDLLKLISNEKIGYDIHPVNDSIIQQDTIRNPPDYTGKWVITNPPYLAQNKSKDKELYTMFELDDLYKISIKTLIRCEGGIIILPLNFFSSQDNSIRREFLSKYKIDNVYVFEEQVFPDTTYNVCSFSFTKGKTDNVRFTILPSGEKANIQLSEKNEYTIGNEIYKLPQAKAKIHRILSGESYNNKCIYINALDKREELLSFSVREPYFGKTTDRCFASIIFDRSFDEEQLQKIASLSNDIIGSFRSKYASLFLTNYRDFGRKRISFDMAYTIIRHAIYLLDQ